MVRRIWQAQSALYVGRGHTSTAGQSTGQHLYAGPRVVPAMHQIGHSRHGVVIRVGYGQLIPGQRDRHGRDLGASHRIRRHHGAVAGVLVEVHKDPRSPFFLIPLRGYRVWRAAPYLAEQRYNHPAHVDEVLVIGDS